MPTEAKIKTPNYSPELVKAIVADYNDGNGLSVKELAAKYSNFNGDGKIRNERSIRSKLVFEKVYKAGATAPTSSNPKNDGPSKKELIAVLRATNLFDEKALTGLESATKSAIEAVIGIVPKKAGDTDEQVADEQVANAA